MSNALSTTLLAGLMFAGNALAAPAQLTSHNETDLSSKAYIAGYMPAPTATAPHTSRSTPWQKVKTICGITGQFTLCKADIKLGANNKFDVVIGQVAINLQTGEVTPKHIEGNGYQLDVVGVAETRISKK